MAKPRFDSVDRHMVRNPIVEIRPDPPITTADAAVATPEDGQELHEWPDEPPEVEQPITVCIMDSGIAQQTVDKHPWFEGMKVVGRHDTTGAGENNDDMGHGTACASVYARNAGLFASAHNLSTPPINLYSVKIFGEQGRAGMDRIQAAYKHIIKNAETIDLVNLSWGANKNIPKINQLHESMVGKSIHDVVAAGNTGDSGGSPATSKDAFSAGAVDENGDLTRFSSSDPKLDNPDVSALGKNVKLARAPGTSMGHVIDEQFVKASGTSFAAPWLGSAYALALHAIPTSWDKDFERNAKDIPGTTRDGQGLLRLASTLRKDDDPEKPHNPTVSGNVLEIGDRDVALIDADWLPNGDVNVTKKSETKNGVTIHVERE